MSKPDDLRWQANHLRQELDRHGGIIGGGVILESARLLDEAADQLEQEHQLREQIEDGEWPYEWQVATAEREKRRAAEATLRLVQRMAVHGPGPGTTPEQALETIVHYIDKRRTS